MARDQIPSPSPAEIDTELVDRQGWERRLIPVIAYGHPTTMVAMCRGMLAVNKMLGNHDAGFATSLSATGFRLSIGGRVFARSMDAMIASERLLELRDDWETIEARRSWSAAQRRDFEQVILDAEQRGQILWDRVFPSWPPGAAARFGSGSGDVIG